MHRADGRIGKGPGVELRRVLGVAVVPEADRVLCRLHHFTPPSTTTIRQAAGARVAMRERNHPSTAPRSRCRTPGRAVSGFVGSVGASASSSRRRDRCTARMVADPSTPEAIHERTHHAPATSKAVRSAPSPTSIADATHGGAAGVVLAFRRMDARMSAEPMPFDCKRTAHSDFGPPITMEE